MSVSAPVLLERDFSSITVAFSHHGDGAIYELQMQICEDSTMCESETHWSEWKTLASALKTNQARKKNLVEGQLYRFRVRNNTSVETVIDIGSTFSAPSDMLKVTPKGALVLAAPQLTAADEESISIKWSAVPQESAEYFQGYQLRLRKDNEYLWTALGGDGKVFQGTEVRKKGLVKDANYYFSVRPVSRDGTTISSDWSVAGGPYGLPRLHENMSRLMPTRLLAKKQTPKPIPADSCGGQDTGFGVLTEMSSRDTVSVLSGKVVLLYFSAKWCGPCRQFTPRLADLYQSAKPTKGSKFEIVFVSCDHDADEMMEYYEHHPWTAIPYNDEKRSQLMAAFGVRGIPQLTCILPNTKIAAQNATQSISESQLDSWIKEAGL